MINIRQFLVAVSLSITGLAALAQTTSPNLVPLPNHWTTNGQSVVQSYAINQALALSGSDVRINGFDYGYQYNLGNSWVQCTWVNNGVCVQTQTYNPRVDVDVSIRDNTNAQIYGTTHTETGTNTGNQSRDFQYRFNDPRDILTLGNFNFTASTSPNATVFGMYSRANYSIVTTTNPTFGDDSYVHIPLQFGFPFYGRVFTNSWMHSNGVVSFLDPMTPIEGAGHNPGAWAYCCSGERPTVNTPQFSYMIAPLWTDLYPVGQSRFRTEGNSQYQRYYWENIAEISNMNNLNTFGLEIRPSGYIGSMYSNVNIQNQSTWIGTIGNPRLGEWSEIQYGIGIPAGSRSNWSLPETIAADCSNPLINPACPGYAQAFLEQQCSITGNLYNSSCPNYAVEASLCQADPFRSSYCPGRSVAETQCSLNPLNHSYCPNYSTALNTCSTNPLSNELCPTYQLTLACSTDPLFSTQCQDYNTAVNACTVNPFTYTNCPGRTEAIDRCAANALTHSYCPTYVAELNYCSVDPLSNNLCPTFQTAVTQCSTNPLTGNYCPNYQTAVTSCNLNQLNHSYCPSYQTTLNTCSTTPLSNTLCPMYQYALSCSQDALYDSGCPGYAEAYAKKNILNIGNTTSPSTPAPVVVVTTTSDPVASAAPVVADPVVNQAITTTTTSASPSQPVAPVQLVPAPQPTTAVAAAKTEEKKEEKKEETKAADSKESTTTTASAGSSDNKDQPRTARQALAERRQAAARAQAVEQGKNLANEMGKAASLEAQIAVQNVVMTAMGFVPGFDTYGRAAIPDVVGYKPFEIYRGQYNVDNPAGRRFLTGADARHQEMVDAQYNR
jgi:hypothetical protein